MKGKRKLSVGCGFKQMPNRKFMTYADTHKGRRTATVLAPPQLAGPYGYSTGHSFIKYYTSTEKLVL
ncbi:Uncharacterized protein FWK35_00032431, partial [Aphis craccivora]